MIIKKDKDVIQGYLEDSSNLKGGFAEKVIIPETIAELSAAIKEANIKNDPITISGGGTGTTGSRVSFGGCVISLERINRIIDVSAEKMRGTVEAGALVEDLKAACEKQGLFYTSHPTEKTASIGGTIATNASGARSFKYGATRKYVRRLKMVLPDGEIFDLTRGQIKVKGDVASFETGSRIITLKMPSYKMPDVKNSAGYFVRDGMDLVDLFIGQEGTLSVIAEAELDLVPLPERIFSAFVFFGTEEDAWRFAAEARDMSRKGKMRLSALSIEYFDTNSMSIFRDKGLSVPSHAKSAVFFEQELTLGTEDGLINDWFCLISKHNSNEDDTWAAMNESEAARLIDLRHLVPLYMNETIRRNGYSKLATDIAVPAPFFFDMMDFYSKTLKVSGLEYFIFGHIGECHLHVNLLPRSEAEFKKAQGITFELVKKGVSLGGTVSAEHGIGKLKHKYLEIMYGTKGVTEMAAIKKALDPNCLLGLDNIFPKEILRKV